MRLYTSPWPLAVPLSLSLLLGGLPCLVLGTIYSWNTSVQPPVDLPAAYSKASTALIEQGYEGFYCFDARLYGNEQGKARPGNWSFRFAHEDGRQMYAHVTFPEDGAVQVELQEYLVPEPEITGRIRKLEDVQGVATEFLRRQGIEGVVSKEGETVRIAVNTRKYVVHRPLPSGAFSEDTVEIIGPRHDGFILRVNERETRRTEELYKFNDAVYFARWTEVFPSEEPGRELTVEVNVGDGVPIEMVHRLLGVFGGGKRPE